MQVLKLRSYATFGTKQFPVNISFIQSSALIDLVKNAPAHTYERGYYNLHDTTLATRFKQNFGMDLWSAVRATDFYMGYRPSDPTQDLDPYNTLLSLMGGIYSNNLVFDNSYTDIGTSDSSYKINSLVSMSGSQYSTTGIRQSVGRQEYESGTPVLSESHLFTPALGTGNNMSLAFDLRYAPNSVKQFWLYVVPDDLLVNRYLNPDYSMHVPLVRVQGDFYTDDDLTYIRTILFNTVDYVSNDEDVSHLLANIEFPEAAQKIDDTENPYGDPGTSGPGGGDGSYGNPDEVDPTAVPELPSVSASSAGFITIYNPTQANLSTLGDFLWSGDNIFDLDNFKKLYTNPMDCIISLGIVPCLPNSGGTRNIFFGNIDTGVNCSYLSTQYAKVDCGSVNITKYVGSFMDYSPYVKVNLFLPYIGFVHLGTDDLMGGSINVTYHVDVLSGDCIAFITHSSKGVLYSYTGNCLTNVPVTASSYASSLRNYYESIMGIIPSTTNGATAGGAAGAAGGAIAGALSAASNIVLNTKPDFQRSGSLGGSSGIMGVQKPFIIIERPNISVPNKVQHYMGQTSNMTASLGGLSGMTIVEAVHLEGIPCTTSELAEIESILHQGVIL